MPTKDEFYRKVDAVGGAAREAIRELPPDLSDRERRLWLSLLSRLPEQIDDMKANFADPHLDSRRNRGDLEEKFGTGGGGIIT